MFNDFSIIHVHALNNSAIDEYKKLFFIELVADNTIVCYFMLFNKKFWPRDAVMRH